MQFGRVKENNNFIEIRPGRDDVWDILYVAAKISYATARPRGLGELQPHQAPVEEVELRQYIKLDPDTGIAELKMNYVNGRYCKTQIFTGPDGELVFDAYQFAKRDATDEEIMSGTVKSKSPEKFLAEVAMEIASARQKGLDFIV